MSKIALICAFDKEIEYFIHQYDLEQGKNTYAFKIGENDVLLVKSGVGKENVANYVQKVIDLFKPDYIISSGCSGALTKEFPLYTVVISDEVFYHDFDSENSIHKYMPNRGEVKADPDLIETAEKASKLLGIESIVAGIASGDCYVTEQGKVEEVTKLGAEVVDMESAALGHVCAINDIPFVCIRSISDFASGSSVDEEESSRVAARVTEQTILFL